MKDLPDRGGTDLVAETGEFACQQQHGGQRIDQRAGLDDRTRKLPSPGDRPADSPESVRNDIETHFPPSDLHGWTFQVSAATEYQKQQNKVLERKVENEVLTRQRKKPKPEIVTKKDTFDKNTMQVRQSRTL